MTSKMEAATIRSQLQVRFNAAFTCYEVYSTIHGSGIYKWFKVTPEIARWYCDTFKLQMTDTLTINAATGEFETRPRTF